MKKNIFKAGQFSSTSEMDSVSERHTETLDIDFVTEAAEEAEKPIRKTKKKKSKLQKLVNKAKKWIDLSTKNKAIAISATALLCVTLVLVICLASGVFGGKKPSLEPIDPDSLDTEIDENYTFVDENEYAGVLLGKTDDAGQEYLDDTLFVGDSNFARIVMYGFLDYDNVIGVESMGIQGVTSSPSVYFSGYNEPVTVTKAVSLMKPRRIVICFGTNNILTNDPEGFIKGYNESLNAIKKAYNYSDIVICAIPPLGANRTNQDLKQETVDAYNLALIEFAKETGYTFLDTSEVLKGSDGYIKEDFIYTDGVHMTKAGFDMFFKYVRTHAHIVDDARPQPIGKIPQQVAPPAKEVEEDAEFDHSSAANQALSLFLSNGFKAATGQSSGGKTVSYTAPLETKAGTESNVANSIYTFVTGSNGLTSGSVMISSSKTSNAYVFSVTVYPVDCKEHKWVDVAGSEVAPTCGADGTKKQKCSVCGKEQTITSGTATGSHKWVDVAGSETAPNCTVAGTKKQQCSVCKLTQTVETAAALGHTWGPYTIVTPATCCTEGSQTHSCSVCKVTETVAIPATGAHTYQPPCVATPPTPEPPDPPEPTTPPDPATPPDQTNPTELASYNPLAFIPTWINVFNIRNFK